MQYMMIYKIDEDSIAGAPPDSRLATATGALIDDMSK